MDLLTPARTWAPAELSGDRAPQRSSERAEDGSADAAPTPRRMPTLQHWVMFASVVGPFVGLLAAVVLLWGRGVGPMEMWVMAAMYSLAGFGVTIGFHRLLTHRAFETVRPVRLFLAIAGSIAAQGAVIRWCATHRRHHQVSDRDGDPHSPHLHGGEGPVAMLKGMWHAHVGWCFRPDVSDVARSIPDLLADRALLFVDRLYFFWVFLGLLVPAAIGGLWTGTWGGALSGFVWGGLARIFLMQHVTWSINSVCHVWGRRPFQSQDLSTNNFPIALVSLGEGWHNNHHAFPTSARHGLKWWQFDSSYLLIRALEKLGLAWNVRVPNAAAVEAKLRRPSE